MADPGTSTTAATSTTSTPTPSTTPTSTSTTPTETSTTPTSTSTTPTSTSTTPTETSTTPTQTSTTPTATSTTPTETSSSSSSSSSQSTAAGTSSAPPAGPVETRTSSSTSLVLSTDAGGGVVTRTSVVAFTSTRSAGPSETRAVASKTFFQNKGAVAGTFSVVGVVVLIAFIVLITNGIRRRRARKFDKEIEEAARDAASARPPDFLDEPDDHEPYYRGGFSDVSSHGTYAQPPMPAESYNMREMGGGVAPGEIFNPNPSATGYETGAAGAAGIGVARARSMGGGLNAQNALREGASPYAAFAGPNPALVPQGHAHEVYTYNNVTPSASRDLLEAAGVVPGVGAGVGLARQGSFAAYEQQQQGLGRNKSMGSQPTSASTEFYPPQAESYNSHQQQQQGYQAFGAGAAQQQQHSPPAQQAQRNSYAYDEEDAYGGYDPYASAPSASSGHAAAAGNMRHSDMPNPYSASMSPPPQYLSGVGTGAGGRGAGEESDEEEEEPRRVLKVANA